MKKSFFLKLMLIGALSLCTSSIFAQTSVTGKVVDADDGLAIPGVVIVVKGTSNLVTTNLDGNYSIKAPAGATLVYSFMGYDTQEIAINNRSIIDVSLKIEAESLTETVVTALGIKREKKALSYAVQEVKSDQLLENRSQNVAGALAGKVAGLNIAKTSSPGGSTRILVRGISSLSGDNSPLIVVDGVPYSNRQGASGDVSWGGTDFGDGLSNLNQDDIESISVLKGPSATALYGSRAGFGVVLITTKKGSTELQGPRINYSSNFTIDRLMIQPEYQNEYGQGTLGEFKNDSRSSWGPKMDGRVLASNNSTWEGMLKNDKTLLADWTGRTGDPFVFHDNDMYNLLQTGYTWNNSVEVNAGTGKVGVLASAANMRSKGVIPNNRFERTSVNLRTNGEVIKNLTMDTKITYTSQKGTNRPTLAVNGYNPMFGYQYVPRSINLDDFFPVIDPNTGLSRMFEAGTPTLVLNPYIATEMKGNEDVTDRLTGFAQLNYKITDWLSIMGRIGMDTYQLNIQEWYSQGSRIAIGASKDGRFYTSEQRFIEMNSDFLMIAKQDNLFNSKLSGSVSFGGNLMDTQFRFQSADAQGLNVGGLYTITNGVTKIASNSRSQKQIQSIYSFGQLSWDNWLFLDVTARNDWSSTLPKGNWSYFYPSVGIGWIVSDMLKKMDVSIPSWVTYAKIRGSIASVGNDTSPYSLIPVYSTVQNLPGSTIGVTLPGTRPNANLKPEIVTSSELGVELRFLDNRIGFDFTYYTKAAKNQIFTVQSSATTGFPYQKINAGRIDNNGVEIILTTNPIRTKNFNWDLTFNYAKNNSKVVELDGISNSFNMFSPGATAVDVKAVVGRPIGELYTTTRVKNADGKYLLNEGADAANYGTPTVSGTREKYVGNMNPDWIGGLSSGMSYKGFHLNCLIDVRVGGYIYLNSQLRLNGNGATKESLDGRDSWYSFYENYIMTNGYSPYHMDPKAPGANTRYRDLYTAATDAQAGIYVEGVGAKTGTPMAGYVNPQYYVGSHGQDHYFYEMTNVRLREISFGYSFPKIWFNKTPVKGLKLSLVVNNVCFLYNNLPGFDPESTYTTGSAQGVETASVPSTRSIGFNLNVSF